MGQHKSNPTAIAAKEGKLPPKEKRLTRTEFRREATAEIASRMGASAYTRSLLGLAMKLGRDV